MKISEKYIKNFNNEQVDFIGSGGDNVLVSASAGTGKTTTMVQKLIYLIIEEHISIDKIMVVTFTTTAAMEMKQRLYLKLQEFLNNPTILQENNKYKNFIQGWEIKIQADWNRSETFGYFTNQEDGIKASHGKGWYGAHGEVNGTKPREIIVFENLDQFNEAKKENNKEIEKMSLNTFNTQRGKGLTFVGISEIGAEKELDNQTETTDNQDSTTNLNASVKGNCAFVKLDSEEAFKARAELMNRFKHDEAENNTNNDIQIDSNTESSELPEM